MLEEGHTAHQGVHLLGHFGIWLPDLRGGQYLEHKREQVLEHPHVNVTRDSAAACLGEHRRLLSDEKSGC